MIRQSSPGARPGTPSEQRARSPELPRTVVDTRMPPAPAPGGRIIMVGAPAGRVRRSAFDGGALLGGLALAAGVTILWRLVRGRRGRDQRVP